MIEEDDDWRKSETYLLMISRLKKMTIDWRKERQLKKMTICSKIEEDGSVSRRRRRWECSSEANDEMKQ